MDAFAFDALARSLAGAVSRRTLVGLLVGGASGALPRLADARKKHKHKKKKRHTRPCLPSCSGKDCGSDGCGGSCGACSDPLTCQAGQCSCPEGSELCGGACLPLCPAGAGAAVIVRHPGTCQCCIRPPLLNCGLGDNPLCCGEPDSLPCCGTPCDPMAVYHDCQEAPVCHYDVECAIGRHCPDPTHPDPRTCEDDHAA